MICFLQLPQWNERAISISKVRHQEGDLEWEDGWFPDILPDCQ